MTDNLTAAAKRDLEALRRGEAVSMRHGPYTQLLEAGLIEGPQDAPRLTEPPAEQAADVPPSASYPDVDFDVTPSEAWVGVMRDVGTIGKDSLNKDQHFRFRGIDATMNTVGPAFRRHGVAVLPVGVEVLESERYASKSGTNMHGMVTRHEWLMLGPSGEPMTYPDGSPIICRTLGQAADSSDKVATKAASVAYRTLLLQSLTVPTGDPDPDAVTEERAAPPDPRQEWWDRIIALAATGRQSAGAIRKHYAEKMGHEIDGPDATVETLTDYHDRLEASFTEQRAKAEQEAAEGTQDPGPAADAPPAEQNATAPGSDEAEPAPEPPPATETQPEPQAAAQGRDPKAPPVAPRDPRQTLWDEILVAGKARGWDIAMMKADFRTWSTDLEGGPFDIDSDAATADVLTRYSHIIRQTQ